MRSVAALVLFMLAAGAPCAHADAPAVASTGAMNFGTVVMDTQSGDTLTLDANTGNVTKAGNSVTSGMTSAGSISLTGTPDNAISITPPGDETVPLTGGDVTLGNFSVTGGFVQNLDSSGNLTLGVGCDLHYSPHISAPGSISTSLSFVIDYN